MNDDFRDMLSALCAAGAEFLIVGAHALAVHGTPRSTGDIDLWVRPTPENALRVWQALLVFGAPLTGLTQADLATPDVVFQIGLPPRRIDVLTSISGVAFADAWPRRIVVQVQGLRLPVLGREDLIANKSATGREKDRLDVLLLAQQD